MRFGRWMRQVHRWLSVLFTLGFLANLGAVAVESDALWVGLLALIPLLLLLVTGLYLFALPYLPRGSSTADAG